MTILKSTQTPVELISERDVWRILHKYASTYFDARSQLGSMGEGKARTDARIGAAFTVAQKLVRSPSVYHVLWLEEAEAYCERIPKGITYTQAKELLLDERAELVIHVTLCGFNPTRASTLARIIREKQSYKGQFVLLLCELSACMTDASFRAWLERA